MAKKSLKFFTRESSIRNEVNTWTLKECEDYVEKHKKDQQQSPSLIKKLKIVNDMINRLKIAAHVGAQERYKLLKGIKIETLVEIAPKSAQDPSNIHMPTHQKNTGIYLWKRGYNPKKYLGKGTFGVVWECDNNKAIKVTCDKNFGPFRYKEAEFETKETEKLKELLQNDKTGKGEKYLSVNRYVGKERVGKKAVLESQLASHGSLTDYASDSGALNQKVVTEGIAPILRMATDALKGLKVIHDTGYSHNDIKPDNLLIIERVSKKISQAEKKEDTLKVSDFGSMSKFDAYHYPGLSMFRAPDATNPRKEAVMKRDSFSLGMTLLTILIKSKKAPNYKELIGKGSEWVYDHYRLKPLYKDLREKVIAFLELIKEMVQPSYVNRISINDALKEIKKIKMI